MAYLLASLQTKPDIDRVIRETKDKAVVLRFGRSRDAVCLQQDDILAKCEAQLAKMADIFIVDVDSDEAEVYVHYFDITMIPATIFFYNGQHVKVDFRSPDNTKFIGAFYNKQDFLDLVDVIIRGAVHGKVIVDSPIPPERIPKFDLLYKES